MDLKPTFEKYYPDGVKGGQCGVFAHKLVEFPLVGDTITSKTATVKKFGKLGPLCQVGDVLILDVGTNAGHVAIVNNDKGVFWQLTESNWKSDERVHHTRLLSKTSSEIVGFFRGALKVAIINPPPMNQPLVFPIVFKIKIVANHSNWPTLQKQIDQAAAWYKNQSGNKINLQFDVEHTDFTSIPFTDYDGSEFFAWGVEKQWHLQFIMPKALGYDMVVFQMRDEDWAVQNNSVTQAVMLGDLSDNVKLQFIDSHCGENTNSNLVMFLDHFTYLLCHEISHAMLALTGQDLNSNPVQNGNVTHQLFYTENFKDAPKIFEVINYQALTNILALRRGQPVAIKGEPMVYFKVKGKSAIYEFVHESWRGYDDPVSYGKDTAGKTVKIIELDQVEFDKLTQLNPI